VVESSIDILQKRFEKIEMLQDPFTLFFKTVVHYGEGKLSELGSILRLLNASKVLVVTDRGIIASGIGERCKKAILSEPIEFVLFDGVEPNPTTDCVEHGLITARKETIHCIVAIGGGSSIDAAKAINVLLTNGGQVADYCGLNRIKKKGFPLIAIPTTAGSGSEMSSYMLISDSKTHQKLVCSAPQIIPDVAILDPTLTVSLPISVTIESGVDALSNGIESYVSKLANPYSEVFSLRSIEILAQNIVRVCKEPVNLSARGQMLIGSNIGALAIHLSSIGAAHSMANPLTKHFNVRHGIAVGMVLPYVMLFNASSQPQKYKQIALALGARLEGREDDLTLSRKGVMRLRELLDQLSLPANLAEMGVREEMIPVMAQEALTQLSLNYNPVKPNLEQMTNLFRSAIRGDLSLATEV
jgi:alcohol dehydrogenase class IV